MDCLTDEQRIRLLRMRINIAKSNWVLSVSEQEGSWEEDISGDIKRSLLRNIDSYPEPMQQIIATAFYLPTRPQNIDRAALQLTAETYPQP